MFKLNYLRSILLLGSIGIDVLVVFDRPGEDVEDLFQGGLAGGVLLDLELLLDVFHHAEDAADRLRVTADFERVRVAVVLHEFEFFEFLLQEAD